MDVVAFVFVDVQTQIPYADAWVPEATQAGTATVALVTPNGVSTALTIKVNPPLTPRAAGALPHAMVGSPYNVALLSGGTPPYWLSTQSILPPGLDLVDGALVGTPAVPSTNPNQPQTYTISIWWADSIPSEGSYPPIGAAFGNVRAARTNIEAAYVNPIEYTLTIDPALVITTTALATGDQNAIYSQPVAVTGGVAPYAITATGLPAGLLAGNGAIGGIPAAGGTFQVNVTATDALGRQVTRPYILTIIPHRPIIEPPVVTTDALPDGTYGLPYAAAVLASGGEEPYTWSAGVPPKGLSVSNNGAVYGVPSDTGTFALPVTVTDAGGRSTSKTVSLKIVAPPLTITTVSPLAGAKTGVPLSVAFSATGGVPPYTWLPSSGPPGTTFAGGSLTGIPAEAGQFTFAVQVRDSKGTVARKEFAVTVTALPPSVNAGALPAGQVGQAYSAVFSALGGSPPYRWSISGLPAGLTGDDAGNIRGNPTATGSSSVTATVTDSKGAQASATVDLTILPGPLSIETGSPLPNGTVGVAYSQSFAACGGTPPYRWSITAGYAGALAITGDVLQGVPAEAGDFNFFVQLTDATGATSSKMFSVKIDLPALTVTTASLPNGTAGLAYAAGVSGSGGVGGMRWSASGLPAGLSMDAGGSIVGTPSAPGASSVSVTVTDGTDRTASKTLSLTVGLPAAPNPSFLGIPDTSPPASQLPLGLGLDGNYPVPIAGTITLTFAADPGGDDPAIQFSNGRRTVEFNIPAGSNLATFTIPALALQTGTVAGTITLTASLSAMGQPILPVPVRTIRINPMPPVISRVSIARTATGFDVTVTGFANTRDISQATFRFTPAAGVTLQTTEVTLPVDALFSRWYQDPASLIYGSQFLFTQPFTIGGDAGSIASVSVTLASSAGRSDPASANIP